MTLASQLDEITVTIPTSIAELIAVGVGEVDASGIAPGLAVGDHAPAFTLPDALGSPVSSADLLEQGPVVVVFYRGDWCPYCNIQLHALQGVLSEITALNATLVAISPQAADHSLSIGEKQGLAFPVLSDADQSTAEAFKVKFTVTGELEDLQVNVFENDPASQNANGERTLPVPSTFIIGTDGVIQFASVNADWRERVEPAAIIAALNGLSS
jgi:peroxiredoxin